MTTQYRRIPEHVGIIPDGNRRWAVARGLPKKADIYVAAALWPDYKVGHLHDAIQWYGRQDITMGG